MTGTLRLPCLAAAVIATLALAGSAPAPAADDASASFHDATMPCGRCHTTSAWLPARFAHDVTGFPLAGRHAEAACTSCHGPDLRRARSQSCAGCHGDRHRGEFGQRCDGCHAAISWSPLFAVDAHRRTLFPLSGRHGSLPCEECHVDKRDGRFTRVTRTCVECHQRDYDATPALTVAHAASRFPTDCARCHTPLAFRQAAFAAHERCFPIATGAVHSVVTCRQCHAPVAGLVANGLCLTGTPRCTQCHVHERARTDREHPGVPGYRYVDGGCVGCHKTTPAR